MSGSFLCRNSGAASPGGARRSVWRPRGGFAGAAVRESRRRACRDHVWLWRGDDTARRITGERLPGGWWRPSLVGGWREPVRREGEFRRRAPAPFSNRAPEQALRVGVGRCTHSGRLWNRPAAQNWSLGSQGGDSSVGHSGRVVPAADFCLLRRPRRSPTLGVTWRSLQMSETQADVTHPKEQERTSCTSFVGRRPVVFRPARPCPRRRVPHADRSRRPPRSQRGNDHPSVGRFRSAGL